MEKLKDSWIDAEESTLDSEQLDPLYLNQIFLVRQMSELAEVLGKLRKEKNLILKLEENWKQEKRNLIGIKLG